MNTYITEDGQEVTTGQLVYDYYSMEPVIIGRDCGSGWFDTLAADQQFDPERPHAGRRSSAGMLDGSRICTLDFARRRGFPGVPA